MRPTSASRNKSFSVSLNHVREHAICGGRPVEDFFPPAPMDVERKRKVARPPLEIQNLCGRCPVEGECLSWALAHREYGIWGGTTEVQRARIRKSRIRSFCVRCDEASAILRGATYSVCMACGLSWKAPGFNIR